MTAVITGLYLGREAATLRSTAVPQVEATLHGFAGDRHTGPTRRADARAPWHPRGTVIANDRQVSLVAEEELAEVAAALDLPEIRPEWLGANVCVRGLAPFSTLPAMTRLQLSGGVTLAVTWENHPCRGPGREVARAYGRGDDDPMAGAFVKAAMHRRGVVATVERAGVVTIGETITVVTPR